MVSLKCQYRRPRPFLGFNFTHEAAPATKNDSHSIFAFDTPFLMLHFLFRFPLGVEFHKIYRAPWDLENFKSELVESEFVE